VDATLLAARLALAAVFGVAGMAKMVDPAGTREALAGFGVPTRLRAPLGTVLPFSELAVAVALVPRASTWWGALGALLLLVLFTVAVARVLGRGERPDCRCFGQLRTAPVGWPTLVRNGVLAAVAGFVAVAGWGDPGTSVVRWLEALPLPARTLAVLGPVGIGLLGVITVLLGYVLAQQARILSRLEAIELRLEEGVPAPVEREEARPPDRGLPVGAPAPGFVLPDMRGARSSLASVLASGRPALLVFMSPGCDPCAALVPEIGRWQQEHAKAFTLVVVSSGSAESNQARLGALGTDRTLLQAGTEVADAYAARWTPSAVLIGRTGRIASPVATGDEAIRVLAAHAATAPDLVFLGLDEGRRGRGPLAVLNGGPPRPGDPAPQVALPDLDGQTIDLRDYLGRDTLVVFWQPDCPHCKRLADDLRRWEAEPPLGAPRLLLISSGSVDANRALKLQSPVLLDEGFKAGKAFGARGTPSAVLVDAAGKIASTIGVGARDVLALAGVAPPLSASDSETV
jgi:thiol-disulfide isomerase/thioredoxin